ncbi:sensor histidine kinase [Xylophilus sp. GOD-11R]|uniref:sensor histidine kinase n=1 Tax=Xylophilus sp. GOD-11R TaxID=3089814 RepID=UPI00298D33CB|nr:sensor histidine kinase N-terminal domain-containing protein [Xylophilus sp. GOD-11R]WPB56917.1 sensor histidine kinase N-terminal domain-containing protein [Xylophilus sp. GOD-11R]
MLTPLLLLWPVSLALTWLVAQGLADKPFDRALEYNVQALAQLVSLHEGRVQLNLPQPAGELLRADDADTIYYQVRNGDGEVLSGERDLALPPSTEDSRPPPTGEVRLRDAELRGLSLRVASTWVRFTPPQAGAPQVQVLVQVAETRSKRSVLATEIIKGVMLPQFAILPLAVLLVWLALARGLKPLSELERRIRARRPEDLSPLDDRTVPLEVAPLVTSVNGLLGRLQESVATQKRFLADAAHQLKTPLAGLRMQADLAQREGTSTEELKRSLQQIGRASKHATHTVNQLLALARAEVAGKAAFPKHPCDLALITIEVVQNSVPRALEKRIDLGYDGPPAGLAGAVVPGNPTLVAEMLRNLVDNAIAYTPSSETEPGVITVRLLLDPLTGFAVLQVEDSGPGIAEAERERVFQPFYRVLGSGVDGSGLGLPIVLEIAALHGAEVTVEDAHPGRQPPGARFSIRFSPPTRAPLV